MSGTGAQVYSATYSGVPVYEVEVDGHYIMRRRSDDFINATHILKVAGYDKPQRTRTLEREVQTGKHDKVQGGYGKYQGTWVPLDIGRDLARRVGVVQKLAPIFNFVPGTQTPPQAPKHTTTGSGRPRAPRVSAATKRAAAAMISNQPNVSKNDEVDSQLNDEGIDNSSAAGSYDDGVIMSSQRSTGRGTKRGMDDDHIELTGEEKIRFRYVQDLLDYFYLFKGDDSDPELHPPIMPDEFHPDTTVDDQGRTSLHMAAMMGDLAVVDMCLRRDASISSRDHSGRTPLMVAVAYTKVFERQAMPALADILLPTASMRDFEARTVFHHAANLTELPVRCNAARYYLDTILNKLRDLITSTELAAVLDYQDSRGDTALTIAARHGDRKCIRTIVGHGASSQICNDSGETADLLIVRLNRQRKQHTGEPVFYSVGDGPALPEGIRTLMGSNPATAQPFSSQSGTGPKLLAALDSTLGPRLKDLTNTWDTHVKAKLDELAESQRVLEKWKAETVKNIREGDRLQDELAADANHEGRRARLASLQRQAHSLLEMKQKGDLEGMIQKDMDATDAPPTPPEHPASAEEEVLQKLPVAAALYREQQDRRALAKDVVRLQSLAGSGDKIRKYRELIAKCLNLKEEEVDGFVPLLIEELQAQQSGGEKQEAGSRPKKAGRKRHRNKRNKHHA